MGTTGKPLLEELEPRYLLTVPTIGSVTLGPNRVINVVSSLTRDLSLPGADQDVAAALSTWASVVPVKFRQTDSINPPAPVILIRGDPLANEGSGVLADTLFAGGLNTGTIRIRESSWGDTFLTQTLRHEIGHALGLLHETDPATPSIMQPYIEDDAVAPTADDLAAIHSLYGEGSGSVSTDTGRPALVPTGIGVIDPATETWYLRSTPSPGAPDIPPFRYGAPGWIPVVGDWDGNSKAGIGVFDPTTATFYLRNEASAGAPDAGRFRFGMPGDRPVVGDWDGTGFAKVGVFDPRTGNWDLAIRGGIKHVAAYGGLQAVPLACPAGDVAWPSVYDPMGVWYPPFRGPAPEPPNDLPVIGDWLGTRDYDLAVINPASETWYAPGVATFAFGAPGWLPVAGEW